MVARVDPNSHVVSGCAARDHFGPRTVTELGNDQKPEPNYLRVGACLVPNFVLVQGAARGHKEWPRNKSPFQEYLRSRLDIFLKWALQAASEACIYNNISITTQNPRLPGGLRMWIGVIPLPESIGIRPLT